MNFSSRILQEAIEAFASLPSIGRKSALRMVLHLAQDDFGNKEKIIKAVQALQTELKICKECYTYADTDLCAICSNLKRNSNLICVVESIKDVIAIEETNSYFGKYHVLGGVISPLEGIGPQDLRIKELTDRVEVLDSVELIMALSPTIDGETTIFYLSKLLDQEKVNISTIARGVAFGGEISYADEITLGRSISSRQPYSQQVSQ